MHHESVFVILDATKSEKVVDDLISKTDIDFVLRVRERLVNEEVEITNVPGTGGV